jgi:DNA mismatch repair protein PMS2
VGKASRTTVVSTQASAKVRDNVIAVYGVPAAANLEEVCAEDGGIRLTGWVSSAVKSSGRSGGDRQFFFLNGRPVDMPRAVKVLNEAYRCGRPFQGCAQCLR